VGKTIASLILGILSFMLSITGVLSLLLSIPGLVLAILALKSPSRNITVPVGYTGKVGKKKLTAQPFVSTKYLIYAAIAINIFSILVALVATLGLIFVASTTGYSSN
jgi:hypothetical protein